MCIVTGPNQDIAIKLIKRMKALFEPHGIIFANKEIVLELNGCTIEAYPSYHLDAYRALDNSKFILLDEADFFRKSEQEDVRPSCFRTLYCKIRSRNLKVNENFRNPDTQLRRNSIGLDKEPNFEVCVHSLQ
jgi:hypothetical protein